MWKYEILLDGTTSTQNTDSSSNYTVYM